MTDFYAQLEEQLLVAGRHRSAQGPARRALSGRGRVLALACVVSAAIGAIAVAVIGSNGSTTGIGTPAAPGGRALPAPAVRGDLEGVRVAVLNATAARGGGRATAEDLAALGARIESISNAAGPGGVRTEVRYRRGASAEARRVAGVLGVRRVTPDTTSPPASPRADVIVLVGADRLRRPRPAPGPPVAPVPARPAPPRALPAQPPSAVPVKPAPPGVPARPVTPAPSGVPARPVKPAAPGLPAEPRPVVTVPAAPAP